MNYTRRMFRSFNDTYDIEEYDFEDDEDSTRVSLGTEVIYFFVGLIVFCVLLGLFSCIVEIICTTNWSNRMSRLWTVQRTQELQAYNDTEIVRPIGIEMQNVNYNSPPPSYIETFPEGRPDYVTTNMSSELGTDPEIIINCANMELPITNVTNNAVPNFST